MSKRRKRKGLTAFAEEFAISLLFEASGGKIGRIRALAEGEVKSELQMSFGDRRALLDSMTKLIATKHKIDPPDDEEDGIEHYREALNGQFSAETSGGGDTFETSVGDDASDI